jgi:excisionase family DNA binding protein
VPTTFAATPEAEYLTPAQAAAFLNVRKQTLAVWRITKRYGLPFVRVGRHIRYRKSDLIRWAESRTEGAVEAAE